jgi:ribonuclease P/MRP protein subunit POP1
VNRFPPNKPLPHQIGNASIRIIPCADLARCELWDAQERESLRIPKYRNRDIDMRREKLGFPGSKLNPQADDTKIPVLLSQHSRSNNHFHGWTLFIPKGWSMAFLQSLVYSGARVIGLKNLESQFVEAKTACYPRDYPTTKGYDELVSKQAQECKARWLRKPPAKRPNWHKLGTRSPWIADWDVVTGLASQETGPSEDLIAVERDERSERRPCIWLFRGSEAAAALLDLAESSKPESRLFDWISELRRKRGLSSRVEDSTDSLQGALISVQVTMVAGGVPHDHAHIYEIEDMELQLLRRGIIATATAEADYSDAQKCIPPSYQIIGYVTTGGAAMLQGSGSGLGTVSLSRYLSVARQSER